MDRVQASCRIDAGIGGCAIPVFRYFNQFGDADPDSFDALICDEAHRIRKTSNSRFTPKDKRSDLPVLRALLEGDGRRADKDST